MAKSQASTLRRNRFRVISIFLARATSSSRESNGISREEEVALAKKIEITRKRFRRSVLACDFAMRKTVETLNKVYQGELPFDRTIKVSLTERLTKEQIQARMPH